MHISPTSSAVAGSGTAGLDAEPTGGGAPSPQGTPRRVFIESFGCQMNDYDVERMLEVLRKSGYERTESAEAADLVVINTCSIREKAENKAASAAGRYKPLKDKNPNLVVAIGGCVAQQEGPALLKRIPMADLTFGPDQIPSLPRHVAEVRGLDPDRPDEWASRPRAPQGRYRLRLAKTEVTDVEDYEFLDADPRPGDVSVTALVTIQKGCDNYCAYCVVPNTRGREVSRPADQVVAEVRRFVERGAREVTLIGQNVNAYHAIGTPDGDDFAELLRRVCAVEGLRRLRYTTSHPHYFSRKVADAFRDLPALCPWLHLPVQAGSSAVLKAMAREYTREAYLEKIAYLRSVCPDISLSTDIIVGYPGETEADFQDTLSLLSIVRYDSIYSFSYSRRPGTLAFDAVDDVPADEKSRRLQAVQALQREITAERMGRLVGRIEPILVEGLARMGNGQLCGRTGGNHTVNFAAPPDVDGRALIGEIVPVRITQAKIHTLSGELLPGAGAAARGAA
jgi:tRNA-2-methylthio-N6-dimethylallyladenosine synthase